MKHIIDDKKFMEKYIFYAHSTYEATFISLPNQTKPLFAYWTKPNLTLSTFTKQT